MVEQIKEYFANGGFSCPDYKAALIAELFEGQGYYDIDDVPSDVFLAVVESV